MLASKKAKECPYDSHTWGEPFSRNPFTGKKLKRSLYQCKNCQRLYTRELIVTRYMTREWPDQLRHNLPLLVKTVWDKKMDKFAIG